MATAKSKLPAKARVKARPTEGRYHFEPKRAERVINFVQLLKHTEGEFAGKPFILAKWQREFIEDVFGWVDENGYRKFRVAYLEIPCRNGKSEFSAAIMDYLLTADGEQKAEVYSVALNRDQAGITFAKARDMIRLSPELSAATTIYENKADWRIAYHRTNSIYRVLTGKASANEGWNCHGGNFDELHTQPSRALWDAIRKRMGSRRQPLLLVTTTAGFDRNSIAWEVHQYAEQIINGTVKDDNFYARIYAAPEDAAWDDEKVWMDCNPALGEGYKNLDIMRSDAREAKANPAAENHFRRLHLNQWTRSDIRAISTDRWVQCGGSIDWSRFKGVPAALALDCAVRYDMAALSVCWRLDGTYYYQWRYYIPSVLAPRLKRNADMYQAWVAGGWIVETPGDAIDQDYIARDIVDFNRNFNIQVNLYDPYNAWQMVKNLEEQYQIEMIEHPQNAAKISAPTKEFLVSIVEGKMRHGDNPVTTWQADNLVIVEDERGNFKPSKKRSLEMIDGLMAAIMAFGYVMLQDDYGGGYYEQLAAGTVRPWYHRPEGPEIAP